MSVDPKIEAAIRDAVEHDQQSDHVADKLVKWLEEVISGNERIEDKEPAYQRLEGICDAIQVDIEEEGNE